MYRFHPKRPRWLTREAAALITIGVFTIARGISYFPPLVNPDRKAAHFLESLVATEICGAIWVTIGLLALAAVRWQSIMPPAVAMAVGLHAAWGASFMGGQLLGDLTRAWVSALSYFFIAALIILFFSRSHPEEIKISKE